MKVFRSKRWTLEITALYVTLRNMHTFNTQLHVVIGFQMSASPVWFLYYHSVLALESMSVPIGSSKMSVLACFVLKQQAMECSWCVTSSSLASGTRTSRSCRRRFTISMASTIPYNCCCSQRVGTWPTRQRRGVTSTHMIMVCRGIIIASTLAPLGQAIIIHWQVLCIIALCVEMDFPGHDAFTKL